MFPISKNFVLCFSILSYNYTYAAPPTNRPEHTSTNSFEQKVQKNIDDFTKFVNLIPHDRDKGEFKARLDCLVKRTIRAENAVIQLVYEKGGLDMELKDTDKFRILLGLTHRVDDLEKSFQPDPILTGDRFLRWKRIFALDTPMVQELREKVTAAGMTEEQFCRTVQKLCNERNDRAGYAAVELPKSADERAIQNALEIMKITADKNTIDVVKILISPIESGDLTTAKNKD